MQTQTIQKEMEKINKIIWKDNKSFELSRTIFIIILFVCSSFLIFLPGIEFKIIGFIYLFIIIFMIYLLLKRRLTFIEKEGIVIGNLPYNKRAFYDSSQYPELIYWNLLKSILIKGKVHSSRLSMLMDYLYLIKKDGKTYECIIYDPKGFIQALKKLKKDYLLDKDSKYLNKKRGR